jgi:hypothetical protein
MFDIILCSVVGALLAAVACVSEKERCYWLAILASAGVLVCTNLAILSTFIYLKSLGH